MPQHLEFGLERPDSDAGDDAAGAQDVQGAEPLHQFEGVVIGEHRHVGEQAHPRGLGREVPERGEGVEVAAAADGRRRGGDGDVFRAGHPVVPEVLRLLHDLHDVGHTRRRLPFGRVEAWVHVQDGCHDAEGERHARNVSSDPRGLQGRRALAATNRIVVSSHVTR